jgi:hypothetical protein
MEEIELEEGEACYFQNDEDSAIDPDVALSYIDEKLQDVLGHFQKDFEVGDLAEMSSQKFNGYGSFLPTYKRYPAATLPNPPPKFLNYSTLRSPNNFHPEGGHQNLILQSNPSVMARSTPASLNTVPVTAAKAPFVNDSFPSSSHAEDYPSRIESTKSAHSVDQKNLKVRIRIKPDNSLTRKKAEIYSGLGLDVSPSSSLDGSLVDSDGVSHEPLAAPYESPTSILQAITSVPADRLLSPLPNDLIYMIENAKFQRMKVSVERKHKTSEKNIIKRDLKDDNNCNFSNDDAQNSINVLPKKGTDTDMLGCDDIVSNTLRLPLLSDLHSNTVDSTKVNTSRKKSKGRKSLGANMPKNEEEDSKKDVYRDLFEEIKPDNGEEAKASDDTAHTKIKSENGPSEFRGGSREGERLDIKKSEIPESSRIRAGSSVDGTVAPPVVKQDWVCCDKCQKWRLLPLGTNPNSLPEKWLCSMLYWLPGLNKCSVPEEETTKALESVPAPGSQSGRHDQTNSMQSRLSSENPWNSDQNQQDLGLHVSKETKKETEDVPNTNNQDLSHLSNSTRRNVMESVKSRSINGDSRSPSVSEKKKVSESHSGGGDTSNSKIRIKRESEQDFAGASKKIKIDDLEKSDEDRMSNHILKVDRSRSSSLSTVDLAKDWKRHSKSSIVNPQDQMQIISEDRETEKKRNGKIFQDTQINTDVEENIQKRGKKARLCRSSGEETDKKGTKDEKNEPQLSLDAIGSLKREIGSVSSSSKVSSSHNKDKVKHQEVKGSPVESVSSSPLRSLNPDYKFTSTVPKMEPQVGSNSRKHSIDVKDEEKGIKNHISSDKAIEDKGNKKNQDHHHHANGSHSRKSGKGSSSRSKDKSKSGSRSDKGSNHKRSDSSKDAGKNSKVEEKSAVSSDKVEKIMVPKKDSKEKETNHGTHDDSDAKVDRTRAKSHSLPPTGRETSRWPQSISVKENGANHTSSAENISERQKPIVKKGENQNGVIKSKSAMTSNGGVKMKRDVVEAPSPIRKDPSSQAASNAIKEAKDLKHLADRLKNSGSNAESTGLYFQAALKFLHGASLLESCNSESGKHGEMIQSIQVYSSTAKLCEFCAHEYEKLKDIAAAALAYKCTEVAYFRVIYSSHGNASRDRNILQTSLQIAPPGESPSSSASDIENLNNSATMVEKSAATTALAKGIASPQVAGNHVIPVRNRPSLSRLLNFTQEVTFAMEASRKSRIAFAAASIKLEEIKHKEGISSVKKALDFNFQDVDGLLHMVRVAMEIINR